MEHNVQRPVVGIFWMLMTGLCFVAVNVLVKLTDLRIPASEGAFLRYVTGLIFLLPMIRSMLRAPMTPRLWRLTILRGAAHCCAVILWFFAMARIPMAEVTAMNYLNPVYVTVLAVFFLGERLALRRIVAVGAALCGTLIILRPGFRTLDPGHIAMLAAAVAFAVSYLLAKMLSEELHPSVIVGSLTVAVTLGLAPAAISVWVWPTWAELALFFGVACFATAGHYTMTLAFGAAPLTVTQPVTFLQLVWAIILGAVLFGESLDIWVLAGGAVILGSVVYITWREAVLKRRITPAAHAVKS